MEEYIKEIEKIAARHTESQSDGYSQIMRICDEMREQQRYCLGYISKEGIVSPQFDQNETKISLERRKTMAKGKPRWKDLPFYERFAKQLKQRGVSNEMCEHIRERGKKKVEHNK